MNPGEENDIHRIGGGALDNLRLKPKEKTLNPPGISVLKAPTPGDVVREIKNTFPQATELHEAAKTIGSTNVEKIRRAGFDLLSQPTKKLPNHHRIIHPEGAAGFSEGNLERLSQAFANQSTEQKT